MGLSDSKHARTTATREYRTSRACGGRVKLTASRVVIGSCFESRCEWLHKNVLRTRENSSVVKRGEEIEFMDDEAPFLRVTEVPRMFRRDSTFARTLPAISRPICRHQTEVIVVTRCANRQRLPSHFINSCLIVVPRRILLFIVF